MIEVLSPGAWSTIQDQGRRRLSHLGVSASGAADPVSFFIANRLVENVENAAVVEMTLKGGVFKFQLPASFAITGGDFQPTLDGKPILNWQTHRAESGSILELKQARSGIRAYLAVSGGLTTEIILGSRSSMESHRLKTGDLLSISQGKQPRLWRSRFSLKTGSEEVVRFTEGADWDIFSIELQNQFMKQKFLVTAQSNRKGVCLENSIGKLDELSEQLTEGVCAGTVQVPPSGKPIILMNDQQTTGGYPQIAQVISADLTVLGQCRPGSNLLFQKVNIETAFAERVSLKQNMMKSVEPL